MVGVGGGGGALRRVGKYEVGRTIGEGNFAKVKFAQNTETGESVAMKVLDRSSILKHKMAEQIKREISIMKLVRHPNVVRLHEVLASRKKIFIILEFITGGELFDKIIRHGRLSEADARKYFQQLIDGVDFCHSKGVYHRDLKPENLLLDSQGRFAFAYDLWNTKLCCPRGGAKSLIRRILDPNPDTRIRIEDIRNDEWFKKNYEPVKEVENEEVNLDDVNAAFDNPEEDTEDAFDDEAGPLTLNAFDLIVLSQGLNLAALFDRRQDYDKLRNRFLSRKPAKVILSTMEVIAQSMGFKTHIHNYKMRVEGLNANKTSHLTVMVEPYSFCPDVPHFALVLGFEVAPSIFMVELQRAAGDTSEYNTYHNFEPSSAVTGMVVSEDILLFFCCCSDYSDDSSITAQDFFSLRIANFSPAIPELQNPPPLAATLALPRLGDRTSCRSPAAVPPCACKHGRAKRFRPWAALTQLGRAVASLGHVLPDWAARSWVMPRAAQLCGWARSSSS
ncbi:hypothetical protein PR202_ga10843 [Eleusine coracana subsp. coracana]|uniref:non-specific serine/threonine protein kinase n=1 Tax=Eleusine coracana subsp. coracana TaxID=191504 RepID=A0AAV5C7R0_ELECO|nr:hypothetical protein PR202_ga10843 [Eleusine coracana subsp. coracana]